MNADIAEGGALGVRWMVGGWRRYLLTALPLVYLVYVIDHITVDQHGAAAIAGYAIVAAFALSWMLAMLPVAVTRPRWFWSWYAVLAGLFVASLPFTREAGFVMCVFLTILTVLRFEGRSWPIVAVIALGTLLVPVAIPAWHESVAGSFDEVTPVAIPIVAITIFGILQVVHANEALEEAQAEIARLAAENERTRIARDLHDLLGHSLTTITVKAELARQLASSDPDRAAREIAEVESLARSSLSDVRAAVSSYREVTLAGELATGRELLRAAGIAADLPRAIDVLHPGQSELFGWVVREGLTNVVRHAHASSCTVRLSRSQIEITDDGVGGPAQAGNGLRGLRERVAAAGGMVESGPVRPRGWRLLVSLTAEGSA